VRSIKRTAEVVPEERLIAEEKRSGSGSSEVVAERVRGVPLQLDPFNPERKLRVCDLNFIHRWVSYIDYAEQSRSLKGCKEPHTSTIRAQ
jgi:hypothetical protein